MIELVVKCDYCPKVREAARNHWQLIFLEGSGFQVLPWNDESARIADAHCCGDECTAHALKAYQDRRLKARVADEANAGLEKKILASSGHTKLTDKPKGQPPNDESKSDSSLA